MQKLRKFTEKRVAHRKYVGEWSLAPRQMLPGTPRRTCPAPENQNGGQLRRRSPRRDWRRAARGGLPSADAAAHTGLGSCREIRCSTSEGSARSPRPASTIPASAEAG